MSMVAFVFGGQLGKTSGTKMSGFSIRPNCMWIWIVLVCKSLERASRKLSNGTKTIQTLSLRQSSHAGPNFNPE